MNCQMGELPEGYWISPRGNMKFLDYYVEEIVEAVSVF